MTRVQKQKLFAKLIDQMTSDDVVDFVGILLESNYEAEILSVMPENETGYSADELADINAIAGDPFISE